MATGEGQTFSGGTAATGETPRAVEETARQLGFGALICKRDPGSPAIGASIWLVGGICLMGVAYGISVMLSHVDPFSLEHSVIRVVGSAFALTGLYLIVTAFVVAIGGARGYFIYANGFVYRHRRSIQAFAWHEAVALRPRLGRKGRSTGKVTYYDLIDPDGKVIHIPLMIENGRDEFMDRLIALMSRHGKPVNATGE